MEFKKLSDQKFQCLLYEEDLEDNNISLDDFFKNDTEKIHSLLDVVMEEAEKSIGIVMGGEVMSLQLAPQPNHSILLTISSGKEDFSNMLKQAGERASKALSSLKPKKNEKSNIIKNAGDDLKALPFESFDGKKDIAKEKFFEKKAEAANKNNIVKAGFAVFKLDSMDDFEAMCENCVKTWGVNNTLYKDKDNNCLYLILEKGRCAEEKYRGLLNVLVEYADFESAKSDRIAWIFEHCEVLIDKNAINIVKKYL